MKPFHPRSLCKPLYISADKISESDRQKIVQFIFENKDMFAKNMFDLGEARVKITFQDVHGSQG